MTVRSNSPLKVIHQLLDGSGASSPTDAELLRAYCQLAASGKLATLEPLLPLMLRLDGRPYVINDHYPFSPFFHTDLSQELVFKTGRQLSKSTSMAASGVISAAVIPNLKLIYITPLFEQIRRFSANYVRPFIDTSPVKALWSDTSTENSVLQRSFKNHSKMIFSFALLDADRTRGLAGDVLNIDESFNARTSYVATPQGAKPLCLVKPGEAVLSFRDDGDLAWDEVLSCSHHGRRACWRVHTADGRFIDATSESWLATDSGWLRVSQLIETLASRERRDGAIPGHSRRAARRRRSRFPCPAAALSRSARPGAAHIQFSRIPDLVRVRRHTSQEAEEQRLRRLCRRLRRYDHRGIRLLQAPLPAGKRRHDQEASGNGHDRRVLILQPDLHLVRTAVAAGIEAARAAVLSEPKPAADAPARNQRTLPHSRGPSARLETTAVTRIEFIGDCEVWDIQTRWYSRFVLNGLAVHNCQDIDPDHIPVIQETLSHSDWSITRYTGTPKTFDNLLESRWRRSSMAEWCIPCPHCTTGGSATWKIPAVEHHLDAMIGPYRDDISEDRPALLCHACRRPINPRFGRWLHRYPERRGLFSGYHVPQIILPLHCMRPDKWRTLLTKRENAAPAVFYNEVLGESFDMGAKLVSLSELEAAATLPWENRWSDPDQRPDGPDMDRLQAAIDGCAFRVLAIDWGGGGKAKRSGINKATGAIADSSSYTTLALVGWQTDGTLKVLWGKRLLTPNDHVLEAKEIARWITILKPQVVAHDYTGAGALRETILVQMGVPLQMLMPIAYVRSGSTAPIVAVPATALRPRDHYQADKTRTLLNTCAVIKLGALRFFQMDYRGDDNKGLLRDFLALLDEKVDSATTSGIYVIRKQDGMTDDFAHSVNLGCAACWYLNDALPDLARLAHAEPISRAQMAAAVGGANLDDWDGAGYFAV